eukprot:6941671-Ditylum_brightwellii.AAC.1
MRQLIKEEHGVLAAPKDVYILSAKGEHIAVTIDFHPQSYKLPHSSAAEVATYAAKDLPAAIKGRHTNAPFAAMDGGQLQAIQQLANIFQKLTHNKVNVKHPRVEKLPKQTVSHSKNTPQITSLPRVQNNTPVLVVKKDTPGPRMQRNNGPHIVKI